LISLFISLPSLLTVAEVQAELPERKAGLWEVEIKGQKEGEKSSTMQQCIDKTTDKQMQEMAQGGGAEKLGMKCDNQEFRKEGDAYISESNCQMMGIKFATNAIATGDFNSKYRVVSHTKYDPPMMGMKEGTMVLEANYKGACAAGQVPGDIIMPGGRKMNIAELGDMMKSVGSTLGNKKLGNHKLGQ